MLVVLPTLIQEELYYFDSLPTEDVRKKLTYTQIIGLE